jgi:hypothetical protein
MRNRWENAKKGANFPEFPRPARPDHARKSDYDEMSFHTWHGHPGRAHGRDARATKSARPAKNLGNFVVRYLPIRASTPSG